MLKTCVVTGSTGCLGMALSRLLHAEGVHVIALGRNKELGRTLETMGIEFHVIDLADEKSLNQICRHADTIFHCAALSSPFGRFKAFYNANVLGTQHIINATPKHARLIHVSSPSVYFNFKHQYNIKENTLLPKKYSNYYIQTKRMAEKRIHDAHQYHGLNAIILRPRGIFGPYDRSIFPRILNLYQNKTMPLIGNGQQLVDITYVDNVAQSLICAAKAPHHCLGHSYNITNDEPQAFIDLLQQVFDAFNLPVTFKFRPYLLVRPIAKLCEVFHKLPFIQTEPRLTPYIAGVMALGQTLDITQAKQALDYHPSITIKEGIKRYAAWAEHA